MSGRGFRWLGVAPVAVGGITMLSMASSVTPGSVLAEATLLSGAQTLPGETALIIGGSGMPTPPPAYITATNGLYLHCDPPACTPQGLTTPEALYPVTGDNNLTFDTSTAQGAAILEKAIGQQLAEGHDVKVFGLSQGASVESLAMTNIVNGSAGIHPDPDQLSFVLTGDPNNPNGGMIERFDLPAGSNPTISGFGITAGNATPVTEYPTAIYSGEYDGFADFPKYPINFLADLNAYLGIAFVHGTYPSLTSEQVADAVQVPTSAGYDGDTTYYMIPTEHLPLLDPLRLIPVLGPLVSDLIEPDLKVLVNLGYGDPDYGWVNADANVPTPAGFLPSMADFEKVPGLLVNGVEQGIQQVISDLEDPSRLFSLAEDPALAFLLNPVNQQIATQLVPEVLTEGGFLPPTTPSEGLLSSIADALHGVASSGYSALLPIADLAENLLTTLPTYDADIFQNELADGNLLDAIGLPIAADFGIIPVAAGLGVIGVAEQAVIAVGDLINPFVNLQSLAADFGLG